MNGPIVIVDYGMGNLASVAKAFRALGRKTVVVDTADQVAAAGVVVLPGVGAFPDAMERLAERGLDRALRDAVAAGRGLLGICLGMQLLFDSSLEKGTTGGLGLLGGRVEPFPDAPGLKVPHMGWNQLDFDPASPLMRDIPQGAHVYFVHSFFPCPVDSGDIVATSHHGVRFPAVVARGRAVGIQFHPEKSQATGLKLLSNVLAHLEGG